MENDQLAIESVYHNELKRTKEVFQLDRLRKVCKGSDTKTAEALELMIDQIQGDKVPQSSFASRLGKQLNKRWDWKLNNRKQFLLGAKFIEHSIAAGILLSSKSSTYSAKARKIVTNKELCLNTDVNTKALRKPLMVTPPKSFESFQCREGGYLSIASRPVHNSHSDQTHNEVLDSINIAQSKPFRIDSYMVKVQEHLFKTCTLPKFNCTREFKRLSMSKIEEATRYVNYDNVYLPYYVDYRSRLYPEPFLSYQGSDAVKSMFCSPREVVITPENYKFILYSVANTLGYDKELLEDRHQIALDLESQCIELIDHMNRDLLDGTDTVSGLELFKQAAKEDIFCFLQSAKAVYDYKVGKGTTRLMPAFDATCSAVQLTSLAYRDRELAREVNVIPTGIRQDIYGSVAETVGCTRSQAKKPVGFFTYGITVNNVINERIEDETTLKADRAEVKMKRIALEEEAKKNGIELDLGTLPKFEFKPWYEASEHAQSISEQVKACFRIMKDDDRYSTLVKLKTDIGKIVRAKDKENVSHRFYTALGFEVANDTYKPKKDGKDTIYEQIEVKVNNARFIYTRPTMSSDISNASKAMANFVHSLDASLIHKVNMGFSESVLFIHDSMACALDMCESMLTTIKEQTVDLFSTDVLALVGVEAELGDLNPAEVLDSEYYFS